MGRHRLNQAKHCVAFVVAQRAFTDPAHVILADVSNSTDEEARFFCLGHVEDGVLTVRFTYRDERIRIFGAGYWRKGKQICDERNSLH